VFSGSISRYRVWPDQAAAHMTAMLKIVDLRTRTEQQLGDLYHTRDFHRAVIGNDSMPMTILEPVVCIYIQHPLASEG
jgi:uncharacterized protein (DUF885 family)